MDDSCTAVVYSELQLMPEALDPEGACVSATTLGLTTQQAIQWLTLSSTSDKISGFLNILYQISGSFDCRKEYRTELRPGKLLW